MKKLFKINWNYFIFAQFIYLISCEEKLLHTEMDPDVQTISKALVNIADEFLIKENINFQIFRFKSDSQLLQDISSNFMSKAGGKFIYRL